MWIRNRKCNNLSPLPLPTYGSGCQGSILQLSHSYLNGCDCLIGQLLISNREVWRIWHFPSRLKKIFFSGAAAFRNRCGGGGQRKGKGKTGRFLSPYLLSANGKCNWQYSRTNTICPSSSWPGPRVRPAAGPALWAWAVLWLTTSDLELTGCMAGASSQLKRLPARSQEKKYWGEKIPSSEEDKRTKYARKRIM